MKVLALHNLERRSAAWKVLCDNKDSQSFPCIAILVPSDAGRPRKHKLELNGFIKIFALFRVSEYFCRVIILVDQILFIAAGKGNRMAKRRHCIIIIRVNMLHFSKC